MKTAHMLLIIAGVTGPALAQSPSPTLISVPGAATLSASGHSYASLLSADRRYVVFVSSAKNLVAGDNLAPHLDVFRHDLQTGETILISTAANAAGGANTDSRAASISSNAQWIAFASSAGNLLPGSDNNGGADIFLVDANTLQRSLVTVGPDGNSPANPVLTRNVSLSDKPQMSANGRWVAFESFATNLTTETDLNNSLDVFLRDTLNQQTALISVALGGGATANATSRVVSITADGNYVLFSSTATNLVTNGPFNGYEELYLRDVAAGITTWVRHLNTIPGGGPGGPVPYNCRWAFISPDGAFVLYKVEFTFSSYATYSRVHLYDRQGDSNILVTGRARIGSPIHMSPDARFIAYDENDRVFLWDRQTGTRTQVSDNAMSLSPRVSDNGSIVAFVTAVTNLPFQIYYRNMATNQLRRLTETLSGGPSSKDHHNSAITVDPAGEFILFDSLEGNLVADDRNLASDIFIHRVATGETRLLSRAHQGTLARTPSGSAGITNFCLSADGNRILFFSSDSNLIPLPGDTNGWQDAFVRDLPTGQTFPLSIDVDDFYSATSAVPHGVLSANGRFALLGILWPPSRSEFSYSAPATIVRKDLDTGQTLPVAAVRASSASFPMSVPAFAFSISADGSKVAYPSNDLIIVADMQTGVQTNLTTGDPTWNEPFISSDGRYVLHAERNSPRLLAVTDLLTGQRTAIHTNYIRGAAFSQDSRHIVYGAPAGAPIALFLYSISGNTSTQVCNNCANASLSADARFVAYETGAGTTRQIELKDMQTGKTIFLTRNIQGTAAANAEATFPAISADGRFVTYTTKATNVTTDTANGWNNLYVYDRLQGTTIRITGTRGNTGYGSGSASRPVLSPGGRTLVFQSFASDFVANDFNDTRDIFLLKLGEGDSDNDGMSDSWEQTHLSTTERDGTGDFDSDGQSDLSEYLAGTNPNDSQSVLEVLEITSVNTGTRQLIWRAGPGKSYRVEYKTDLQGAAWTSLGQVITATSGTASAMDTVSAEKRFYRVALVQ